MRAGLPSFGVTLLAMLWGCSDSSLEVRGSLDRVVGETVTLSLVEGETGFSGEVELIAADQTPFSTAALKVQQTDERKLTFVIPPGIAAGRAVAKAARVGALSHAEAGAALQVFSMQWADLIRLQLTETVVARAAALA